MPNPSVITNSFNAGELSPRLYGRTDLSKYLAGVKTLLNFNIHPQGGVQNRSGTRFVLEVEDSAVKGRVIPFVFSTEQAYVLELCDLKMRVFRDEGNVESAPDVPFELVTTYEEADLPNLRYTQSADTLYVVHADFPPRKITRTGHAAWTIADIAFEDGPYLRENSTTITVNPDALAPGVATLTASAALFAATDVGRMFRWLDGTNWFWGLLSNYVNPTTIDWTIEGPTNMANHDARTTWRLGAWGSAASLGYPTQVVFNEQRLIFAANPGGPQTIYASVSADFENMMPTGVTTGRKATAPTSYVRTTVVADDNALTYTISASQVNAIRWLNPIRSLLAGTSDGIYPIQSTSRLEPITPTSISARRADAEGSADAEAVNIGNQVVALSRSGLRLNAIGFDFDSDSFRPDDLTILADHIAGAGIDQLAYAHEPNRMLYAVRSDGVLAALTYQRQHEVQGWGRHILGGSFGAGDAMVESVAVIPSPDGDPSSVDRTNIAHDQVWLLVKRTIDGSTVRYIEFIEDDFSETDAQEDAFFVDCGLTYDGVAVSTISGLDHLEGETVKVLGDGAVQPDKVVSSGAITLSSDSEKVHVGLGRNSDIEGLRMALPDPLGSAMGKLRRPVKYTPLFHRTLGGQIGRSSSALDPFSFRTGSDPMDAPPPLFSGLFPKTPRGGYDRDGLYFLRQHQPLPMTLVLMAYDMVTES